MNVIRDFYNKNFDAADIRACVIAAISIKVIEPVFESQTKTKLGSLEMAPGEIHVRTFVGNFLKEHLDNYLHRNPQVAEIILKKIQRAERERKDLQGIRKLAQIGRAHV